MSVSGEQGCSSSSSAAAAGSVVQVCFPSIRTAVLENLNRQREDGRLCDLSIQVQGQVFRAHRCVLAASSPYFHDQVLLKNMSTVSIPAVMDPLAFESVLSCAYTGELRMLRDDIVNYLTVGSVLQMWHIVDKCTELLKEGRGGGGASQDAGGQSSRPVQSHPDPQPPTRPNMNESQSPSSTNYFSPREAGPSGGGASGEAAAANSTPSYCTPSGGDEGFLIGEDEEEEEELLYPRKQERGSRRRKKSSSAPDQVSGVSDSFGVSSYQDGEPSPSRKRPAYIQPSIVPRKQWVVVKKERPQEDELIVVSGEEGGEEDEELEAERDRERTLNISNVRTLSMEMSNRAEADMEPQDYCQEDSEDYLKFESDLMDQGAGPLTQGSLSNGRPVATLVQSGATRHQLFPLDMQGNQILVYSQGPVDATSVTGGVSLKGVGLEHGAVHLGPGGGGLDGLDGAGGSSGGKVFMCHCGKTFTHKSMRDRHVNMHLDLRPFHCPICSKKFKMKHHLTEHMKTHTGLKPYDCHSCGKKFMWRDSFMRHRSHCERRGGGVVSDGGGAGVDGGALIGGRAGIPVLSPHHSAGGLAVPGALLGVSSHSLSSAVFGLGAGRASCEEEVCEVGESSVT